MERDEVRASAEALLFTMGDSISAADLAAAIGVEEPEMREVLRNMQQDYEAADRGIRLLRLEDNWQLCTKKEYYEVLIRLVRIPRRPRLTEALMETLSIIAYRQPVTRLEIEKIRGVKSDHAVNRLIEYNLACEVGRLNAPGRPILLGTTEEFLRHFGLESLEELPQPQPGLRESFKAEAEREAGIPEGAQEAGVTAAADEAAGAAGDGPDPEGSNAALTPAADSDTAGAVPD